MSRGSLFSRLFFNRKQPSVRMLLFFVFLQLFVNSALFYVVQERVARLTPAMNLLVALLFLGTYVGSSLVLVLDSTETIKKRFGFAYHRLSASSDDQFYRRILLLNGCVETLLALPLKLPIWIVWGVTQGGLVLLWLVVLEGLTWLVYFYLKGIAGRQSGVSTWLSLLLGRAVLVAVGYGFFWLVAALLKMTRSTVAVAIGEAGWTFQNATVVVEQINTQLEQAVRSTHLFDHGASFLSAPMALHILVVLVLLSGCLSVVVYKAASADVNMGRYTLWRWMFPASLPKAIKNNPFGAKDQFLLQRVAGSMSKPPASFVLPGELFLLVGANLALLPMIHNPYIFLLLFFAEGYGIISGSAHTLAVQFASIFQFEDDIRHILLYALSPHANPFAAYSSKRDLLIRQARRAIGVPLLLLAISFACWMRIESFWLLLPACLLWLLFPFIAASALKVPYHIFTMLLSARQQIEIEAIQSYSAYPIISFSDHLLRYLCITVTTAAMFICALFVLVQGTQWLYFDGIVALLWSAVFVLSAREAGQQEGAAL
ncbi:MAG: hypothetical protein IMW91_09860 [Firmicutes bacterium]|nr:hypothetical protein [Bacillota bacterium]